MCPRLRRIALFGVLALAALAPAHAQPPAEQPRPARIAIAAHVEEASRRFGVPAHWIWAVIRAESAGQVRAVSRAGAMGLMQLMPGTWARQRALYDLGSDPFDPRDNILAGTSYLREMYDRYGAPGFLAAYNAGPGRYEQWRAGRRRLPRETQLYVARLAPELRLDRLFAAAEAFPQSRPIADARARGDAAEAQPARDGDDASGNPFALPAQPTHDLFVAVSTAVDP
ncbi:lytic transglycosylase domain-containing protein [Qipengyuania qiaonensis]|uniref:Lytic transglycosylase domain-containing protein n=1 Tax=Qipengyuania qiaonensis TaxID=2867240 RepID=A0ABS7J5V0_9SPHN|nr:lytic transglycosylase domain-containing protein [Qipengyuania qiaonensis]MBX7481636.1 lytic transglycosylase domain-containing protein [Qipengyuania qiaonensis]